MITDNGVPNEAAYPYSVSGFTAALYPTRLPSTVATCFPATVPLVTFRTNASAPAAYRAYSNLTTTALKNLLQNGTVVALVNADAGFMALRSGVYSGCPAFDASFGAINHAVEIVGYDANDNWIVKNSWGTVWGVNGYGTISNANDCALTAYVFQLIWAPRITCWILSIVMLAFFF